MLARRARGRRVERWHRPRRLVRECERCRRGVFAPSLAVKGVADRAAHAPAGLLEHRSLAEVARVTDAQIRDWLDAGRERQLGAEHCRLDDAHPADADPLGARGEPQVLDRAAHARAHGLRLHGRAEDRLVPRAQIGDDANVERRIADALELVREVLRAALVRKARGLRLAAAQEARADAHAPLDVAHDDEPPRLRETHARRERRRPEDARERRIVDLTGDELANVAAKLEHAIDRRARVFVEAMRAHGESSRSRRASSMLSRR